jgi:hypothetical protein
MPEGGANHMPEGLISRVWTRVRNWFSANAEQMTLKFFPDDGEPIRPYDGYVRLWLSEGYLAQRKQWTNEQFPALHGGARLAFLGNDQAVFSRFERAPGDWQVPGVQLDFPITSLLPFNGGTVEVEAALYQATVRGPLGTAVQFATSLAPLIGPPLSTAVVIADKISDGIDAILESAGNQPVLGLHWTFVAPGGGGQALRQGHLALVGKPEDQTGADYLVVRVECRNERDDWRLPELDALIREAGDAFWRGQTKMFKDRRTNAIARAWNSLDLVPNDRKRVALLVQEELDGLGRPGVVPAPGKRVDQIAAKRLLAANDPQLHELSLSGLLGAG